MDNTRITLPATVAVLPVCVMLICLALTLTVTPNNATQYTVPVLTLIMVPSVIAALVVNVAIYRNKLELI